MSLCRLAYARPAVMCSTIRLEFNMEETNQKTKYYLEKPAKILIDLGTTENGLAQAEAEKRLLNNGKNKLKEPERDSLLKKFLTALADPMIIMLIAAAAVQALVTVIEAGGKPGFRDFADVIVILVVVIINSILIVLIIHSYVCFS